MQVRSETDDSSSRAVVPEQPQPSRRAVALAYGIAVLAPLVTAGLYFQATRAAGVDIGFPLDDSWIHAQYSRTIVEGHPFEYVPDEPSIGSTSVLFDVVWAAASRVTGEYIYTVHVLNLLLTCGVGALVLALLLRFRLPPFTAAFGAALIVNSYPFPWSTLSGMETALATFLTVGAVLAHVTWGRRSGWRMVVAPILMALAAMARPENLVLFPLSEIDRLILRWRGGEEVPRKRPALRFALRAAALGLTMLPYFALNYSVHGAMLPNTYAAKIGTLDLAHDVRATGAESLGLRFKVAWDCLRDGLGYTWGSDNAVLLAMAAVGILILFVPRRYRGPSGDSLFPLLVFVAGCTATGIVTLGIFFPGQSQRYLIQWIPLLLIYGVVGLYLVAGVIGALLPRIAKPARAAVVVAAFLGSGLWMALEYPDQVTDYVTSVKNINEMQVALGRWVNEHTPPEAVIATNDIGAIAFYGNRPIVDTIGLIDPEVVRRKNAPDATEQMIDYLRQRGATHALLFPTWHPDLILDEHFRPVHRVVLDDNVICGDSRMLVMALDWDLTQQDQPSPEWADEEYDNAEMWYKVKTAFNR